MGLVLGNKITAQVLASVVVFLASATLFAAEPRAAATTSPAPVPPRRLIQEYHQPLYELRVMQASPGKLNALHTRIRDHQIPIMEQHGLTTLAVFVPAGENPDRLVYLITGAEGLTAMTEGWAEFRKDRRWATIVKKTKDCGDLVNSEDYARLVRTSWSLVLRPVSLGDRD